MKNIIFNSVFNITLFLLVMVGIQNSSKSLKVNLILWETIKLPVAFIVGISYISGSIAGGIISLNLDGNK